ncbi:retrovirus-related pol polyprotein from transposon TNT 1-94, partial [Tanacetum coccineum]
EDSITNAENGLPPDVYALANHQESAKDIWDRVKLLMKGTELSYQEHECRLYNLFDKFAYVQGETLYEYYWIFSQLVNDMDTIGMTMTFTIVGNKCPLTRITSTNEVPLKETTITPVIAQSLALKVYSRKPKASRSVGSSSKAKIVESKTSNTKEAKQFWDPLFLMFHLLLLSIADNGYGDYQMGNVTISQVYYIEGLSHNLFSVGQFCDSDLEVAFHKHTCFIRDLDGADLLKGSRDSNLYTLSMENLLLSSPICLLSKASKTKSWLWHRRLSHLNFDYITALAKHGLVRGLPKLKYQKDHLCSACALGKSKKYSHKPKAEDSIQEKLYLLHMDLCGPMRIQSINGRKYILVIVENYSRFTWVKFLRSKDEVPEFVIKFLKMIQVRLNATVRNIKTNNGTEFVNQTMKAYYEEVGISHQTSIARTPQQNGVVERRNRTLVEAARTMLIFLKAPSGKLKLKDDMGIFVGYAPAKKAFRIYNKRMIIETIHFDFDELTAMASEQFIPAIIAPEHTVLTGTPSSTIIDQDAPSSSTSQTTQETLPLVIPLSVEEADHDIEVAHIDNNPFVEFLVPKHSSEESSTHVVIPNNVHSISQPPKHINKWTKYHLIDNAIGDPSRLVSTRHQLQDEAIFCYFDVFLSSVKPKSYKEALA